jgi:hypothetical protein
MRMRIHESWQNNSATTVDFGYVVVALEPRIFRGLLASSDRDNLAADAEDGGVFDNAEVTHVVPTTRSVGASEGEELRDISEKKSVH